MANAVKADSTVNILKDENISGTYYSDIIDIQRIRDFSFMLIWEGTNFLGNVSIECSNDLSHDTVKEFVTIDRSKVKLKEDDGKHMYTVEDATYRFIRLKIEPTTGNATFNVYFSTRSGRI